MKLSKKIVAAVLTIAMVVTQVSVFSFASGNYTSGNNDDAYYAMKVPTDTKVTFGTGTSTLPYQNGYVTAGTGIGRNDTDTGFASDAKGSVFTTAINGERFFKLQLNTTANKPNVIFKNIPLNTYSGETTPIYNGIPSSISLSKVGGMLFRIKGDSTATPSDTVSLEFVITGKNGAATAYTAKNTAQYIDIQTGKVTDIAYSSSTAHTLPGNLDGYVYIPYSSFSGQTGYKSTLDADGALEQLATTSTSFGSTAAQIGYKGIKLTFKSTAYNGKTLYVGNAYFAKSYDKILEIYAAPDAPTRNDSETTETKLVVNAVSGVEYSLDKINWNSTGVFEGLEEGGVYDVFARYSQNSRHYASAQLVTKGLSAPVLKEATVNSITVNVVAGQEYSLDKQDWNTTGVFEDLLPATKYTVYTRLVGNNDRVREKEFETPDYPYSSGNKDGAFEALIIGDDFTTTLPTTHVTVSGGVEGTSGALNINTVGSEKFVEITSNGGVEGSATINGSLLTYGIVTHLPEALLKRNASTNKFEGIATSFKGVALRFNISGVKNRNLTAFDVAMGKFQAIDADYAFIDAKTGAQSVLTHDRAFTVTEDMDGWLLLPFNLLREENGGYISPEGNHISGQFTIKLHGSDCTEGVRSDWTDVSFNVGNSYYYTDDLTFKKTYSAPIVKIEEKSETSIFVVLEDGVEYSINGEDFQLSKRFENLTPATEYTVYARYIGETSVGKLKVKTRNASTTLKDPVFDYATTNSIVLKAEDDHEYSADGTNWYESGVIPNLKDGTEYVIYSRRYGTVKLSAPLLVSTIGSPYSTNNSDSGSYFFRVPNKKTDGSALPSNGSKNYLSGTLLNTTFDALIGKTTTSETEAAASSEGGVIYTETLDGKSFLKLVKSGDTGTDTTINLNSNAYYNGKQYYNGKAGIPAGIDAKSLTGFAIRVAVKGGTAGQISGIDFKFKRSDSYDGYPVEATQFEFIDAKTGEMKTLEKVITKTDDRTGYLKIDGELDGWIIVPFTAFWQSLDKIVKDVEQYFTGLNVVIKDADTDWSNRTLYIGDSVLVYDTINFVNANAAPNAPTLAFKDDHTLQINTVTGIEYSIDNGAHWQTTDTFTGLNENTAYTILARRIGRNKISKSVWSTDYTNPPLTVPEFLSKGHHEISVKIIPGLEYSIDDGKTWNETGIFTELDPGTTYYIVARSKKNTDKLSEALEVTTDKYDNPYDRGDGSSDFMPMSRYSGNKYNEYWFSDSMGLGLDGVPHYPTEGGYLDIVEIDGERFINFKVHALTGTNAANFCLKGHNTYGQPDKTGFPNAIWARNFWGFATRMKLEDNGTNPGYHFYFNIGSTQDWFKSGATYYLIDSKTKTWEKKVIPANNRVHLGEFDGWLLISFEELINKGYTWEQIQKEFSSLQPFLRSGSNYANGEWTGVNFYISDTVIVEDVNLFTDNYAPNTTNKIENTAHNKTTDASIPAIMVNDATGCGIGDGLYGISGARASIVDIVKPNEKSKAVAIYPSYGVSSIYFQNDSLNYENITQDMRWDVMDSVGVSIYIKVPENADKKIGFTVESSEGPEKFYYNDKRYYYTISEGVISKNYGKIEFKPGFEGNLVIPFDNFTYDLINSTGLVDGTFFSPDLIDYFGFSFDAKEYPALNAGPLIVDDFVMYQSFDEFSKRMSEIQGGTGEFVDNVKTFRQDDYPEFPRYMANDCTDIEEGKGIFKKTNVILSVEDKKDSEDSFINIEIGSGASNVQFKNYAFHDELTDEEREELMASEGTSFWVSVPEDAPMTVGLDYEICEDESEYFLYDPNTYYYVVRDGQVYQVYGYLEFEPGFNGMVLIPFENMVFDQDFSDYYDGELLDYDLISHFGLYFNTEDYASIGGTKISVDDISFYQNAYEYIDAIWSKQTNGGTYTPPVSNRPSNSPNTGEETMPIMAVAGLAVVASGLIVFTRKKKRTEVK